MRLYLEFLRFRLYSVGKSQCFSESHKKIYQRTVFYSLKALRLDVVLL